MFQPVITPVASGTLVPDALFKSIPNRFALMNISRNFGITRKVKRPAKPLSPTMSSKLNILSEK